MDLQYDICEEVLGLLNRVMPQREWSVIPPCVNNRFCIGEASYSIFKDGYRFMDFMEDGARDPVFLERCVAWDKPNLNWS